MAASTYVVCLLGAALLALIAYVAGRRSGLRAGYRRAARSTPLALRELALQSGVCPVCDGKAGPVVSCGQNGR